MEAERGAGVSKQGDALEVLLNDASRDRLSITSYMRVLAACRALALSQEDTERVLVTLEYHSEIGTQQRWLATKIAERNAR